MEAPKASVMNIHRIDRKKLLEHLRAVEQKFPLRFVGLLPRGTAAHVFGDNAVDLLAEKLPGLSLTGLTGAELELSARLKRPVGIVLKSELRGREEQEVLAAAQSL
jgi:predicted nucleotidyltransferase